MEVMNKLDNTPQYETLKRYLEQQLIKHMNKYIKKNFNIELVFHSIKKSLKRKKKK